MRRISLALILITLLVTSALFVVTRPGDDGPDTNADSKPAAEPKQVPGLPPGATQCDRVFLEEVIPFNAGARGTPMTSCPFVEQVRRAYNRHNAPLSQPQQMRVPSPATGDWYDLVCAPTGKFVTCMGGVGAVIYLYNA